jgi:hypothetical protein
MPSTWSTGQPSSVLCRKICLASPAGRIGAIRNTPGFFIVVEYNSKVIPSVLCCFP